MSDSGNKVRWGIIGAGSIARHAVAPAIRGSGNGILAGVASRDGEKAGHLAREMEVPRHFASYEKLLESPDIDAVYIGLPNGLHEEWVIRCANAGKHVLCEKSLTFSRDSAERMVAACEGAGVILQEAFMYRHHPQWSVARDIVASGRLGGIRSMAACFTGMLADENNHRWSAELGMGALYDVTCYGINVCRYLLGGEPLRVACLADDATPDRVDAQSHVSMLFAGGVLATAVGSLRAAGGQAVVVTGERARLAIDSPFIPGTGPVWMHVYTGGESESIEVAGANHFLHEVEHFAARVLDPAGAPVDPAENGFANVAVCDAAWRSWTSRQTLLLTLDD